MALLAAVITALCLWVLLTPPVLHGLGRLRADAKPAPLLAAFVLSGLVQWLRAWRSRGDDQRPADAARCADGSHRAQVEFP